MLLLYLLEVDCASFGLERFKDALVLFLDLLLELSLHAHAVAAFVIVLVLGKYRFIILIHSSHGGHAIILMSRQQ